MVFYEEYRTAGRRHRDPREGPAQIERDRATGALMDEFYYVKGRLHRADGPARVMYDQTTGIVMLEQWYRHGCPHRVGFPNRIERDGDTGEITRLSWSKVVMSEDGLVVGGHRDAKDGPADISLAENYISHRYQYEGEHHRPPEDGPAYIRWNLDTGEVIDSAYWVHGKRVAAPVVPRRPVGIAFPGVTIQLEGPK